MPRSSSPSATASPRPAPTPPTCSSRPRRRRRLEAQRPEDLDHLGALRRLVLGRRAHRSDKKHDGISLFLMPMDHPGLEVQDHADDRRRDHQRGLLQRRLRPDDYLVGEEGKGFQYISEALDLERFTMFTFSPIEQRLELLIDYVKTATRDGTSRCATIRRAPADRPARRPRPRSPGCWVCASCTPPRGVGGKPPTVSRRRVQALRHDDCRKKRRQRHGHRWARAGSSASTPRTRRCAAAET